MHNAGADFPHTSPPRIFIFVSTVPLYSHTVSWHENVRCFLVSISYGKGGTCGAPGSYGNFFCSPRKQASLSNIHRAPSWALWKEHKTCLVSKLLQLKASQACIRYQQPLILYN